MSRIGKIPIIISDKIDIKIDLYNIFIKWLYEN